MESIGQFLKTTRETRGYSLDQAARETNISRHFLVSLEEEKYGDFPAEAYILGFLRTYSEFLGLGGEDLVNKYKTLQIQEQPAPIGILLGPSNPWPLRLVFIFLALAILGLVVYFVSPTVSDWITNFQFPSFSTDLEVDKAPKVYTLGEDQKEINTRLYIGDTVKVVQGVNTFDFRLEAISDHVLLNSNVGETRLKLGSDDFLDLDNNNSRDIRIFVQDLSTSDPTQGAVVSFERMVKPSEISEGLARVPLGEEKVVPGSQLVNAGSAARPDRQRTSILILESPQAGSISLEVIFRGNSFFRYLVDDTTREEVLFVKGDRRVINAEKRIVLWVANSASFSGRIQGREIEMGTPGQVSSKVIEWVKNNQTGLMELRANPIY